jgi:hypothetical protein
MATVIVQAHGPQTYLVSAVIAPGQVVAADQTVTTNGSETVLVAPVSSLKTIGVALTAAAPAGTDPATDAAARPNWVSVATVGPMVSGVTFAANAKLGDRLKAAAAGQVTPFVDGTDTDDSLLVGICASASVTSTNQGNMFIIH